MPIYQIYLQGKNKTCYTKEAHHEGGKVWSEYVEHIKLLDMGERHAIQLHEKLNSVIQICCDI